MVNELERGRSCWNQPAGHVELGESLVDAALRETLEETGYQIRLDALQGIYQETNAEFGWHSVRVCFMGTALAKISQQLDTDIIGCEWLPMDDLLADRYPLRSELTRLTLQDFGKTSPLPLSIVKPLAASTPLL